MDNLTDETTALGTALGEAAKKDGKVDPEVFRPLCGNWIAQGREAQAGLPVPDTPLQTLWQQTTEEAVQGGTDCVQGLRDGDSAKLTDGLEQIHRATAMLLQFATLLQRTQEDGTPQEGNDK